MKAVISAALDRLQGTLEDDYADERELENGKLALNTLRIATLAGYALDREGQAEAEPHGDPKANISNSITIRIKPVRDGGMK